MSAPIKMERVYTESAGPTVAASLPSTFSQPIPRSASVSCHTPRAAGGKKQKRTPLYQRSMSFDPSLLHSNGFANGTGVGLRETGVVEKLLSSYGFIQCSERQARLFFHCSQYNGNLQELKIGDDVEFEVSSDKRTGKPIAVKLVKIKAEVLPEERISGQVVSAIPNHLDGRSAPGQVPTGSVCYERNGEVFYLTYTPDDVEGNQQLETGDKVSFYMETNKHTGAVSAHNIVLVKKKPMRYQGVVCATKDAFGFIERADVVKEIFFHYSEFKGDLEALQAGDDVEFSIKDRNVDRMGDHPAAGASPSITPVQQMVASSAGALLTALFVTPLDVVKIRLQSQQAPLYRALSADSHVWNRKSRLPKWKCFLYCNGLMDHIYVCQNTTASCTWYKTPTQFSGTLDAFVKITRSEGLRSLWSGLPPTLVMAVPTTVIYFTCYDQLKDYISYGLGYHSNYVSIVAGGLARLGAVTVITPLELVRTKMQSRRVLYSELRVCIRSAVSQSGMLSLWRGWGPTVLRDVPFSAMYWFNYELMKAQLCETYRRPEASFAISFTSGAISGAIAAITTLPFDVVKTRRQIELGEMEFLGAPLKKPSSTWLIMKNIWTENGYRGLFAGFLPRVIKVAPACAIMISTYEFGKTFFRKHNEEQRVG